MTEAKRRVLVGYYGPRTNVRTFEEMRTAVEEVQTLAAARAEERRRLAMLAMTGSPVATTPKVEQQPDPPAPAESAPAAPTFGSVVDEYLRTFAPSHLKPSTQRGYRMNLNAILLPRLDDASIDRIGAKHVREIDAELVRNEARRWTRRQVQAVLRSVLCRFAVEVGYLKEPPSFPKLPRIGRTVLTTLTKAQVDQILAVSKPAHRLAFLLAAYAGLRAGEVRGLRWRDVDLEAGRLVVRQAICCGIAASPKSGHERVVPLARVLHEALAAVPKERREGLAARTVRGTAWSEYALANAFRRACKRAGLEGWRLHDLRHFFVTTLFKSGASAPTVQMLAGHADLTTTQRYAHVAAVDLRAAIDGLGVTAG